MTDEEKIIEIYESGNRELAYELMQGVGLDVLNIDFSVSLSSRNRNNNDTWQWSINYYLRHEFTGLMFIRLFAGKEQFSEQNYDRFSDIDSYEVTFHNSNESYLQPEPVLEELKLTCLSHKFKMNVDKHCLAYVSREEILRIIFAK